MLEFIWRAVARIASRPTVTDWLIRRAQRTPYYPITARDNPAEVYMDRWWLFNPYGKDADGRATAPRWEWLPSIRIHHIKRADDDGHLHDHPWNARTVVLRGWYVEERPVPSVGELRDVGTLHFRNFGNGDQRVIYSRQHGYTGRVLFEQYHRISEVASGGVFTLWFTWRYRGTWGFLVDGKKVPHREYLGLDK